MALRWLLPTAVSTLTSRTTPLSKKSHANGQLGYWLMSGHIKRKWTNETTWNQWLWSPPHISDQAVALVGCWTVFQVDTLCLRQWCLVDGRCFPDVDLCGFLITILTLMQFQRMHHIMCICFYITVFVFCDSCSIKLISSIINMLCNPVPYNDQ